MIQEFLHIDATPNEMYPLRILQAYRRLGDSKWSSSSMEVDDNHPLIKAMNDAQEKRNALLDRAIEVLETQLLRAPDSPSALVCTCRPVNNVHYKDCPLANSAGR